MCNLSQGIRDRGIAEGISIGMAQGMADGITKGKAEGEMNSTLYYVKKLMQINNISAEEAMNILGVNEDIRPDILKSIETIE